MSNISISGNTSGTGTFSLEAPATNGDKALLLTDVAGNVVVSDGTTITADYTNNRFTLGGTVVFNGLTTNFNKWEILNANTSLVANKNYFANTQTTLTLTLPSSANIGDTIRVFDNEGYASANVVTIARNGNKIDGFERNIVITTNRDGVELVYVGPEVGFITRDQQSERLAFSTFQGSVTGYTSGGSIVPGKVDTIDKFPFAVDTNATDVGDLSQARLVSTGQSSQENGYTSGGYSPGRLDTIDKFPFATDANATDVGNLTQARSTPAGHHSSEFGYSSGGFAPPESNVIDKFPFSTDTNATDVSDLTQSRRELVGHSSKVSGYASGGITGPGAQQNTIDKFPFASDANATDVGNLTETKGSTAGQSSTEFGYSSGGEGPPTPPREISTIEKFSFASDANATDVGDLTLARYQSAGQSSTVSGYNSGGTPPNTDTIDKFPFAVDTNATDVGNLSQARRGAAGQQV